MLNDILRMLQSCALRRFAKCLATLSSGHHSAKYVLTYVVTIGVYEPHNDDSWSYKKRAEDTWAKLKQRGEPHLLTLFDRIFTALQFEEVSLNQAPYNLKTLENKTTIMKLRKKYKNVPILFF